MEDFELQNIEYKTIWKKEYLKEICGMDNADGLRIYIGKDAGNPEPLIETASSGLDFSITFQSSRLYRAIEKYRELNSDAVVD